jgi:hypothetical protein
MASCCTRLSWEMLTRSAGGWSKRRPRSAHESGAATRIPLRSGQNEGQETDEFGRPSEGDDGIGVERIIQPGYVGLDPERYTWRQLEERAKGVRRRLLTQAGFVWAGSLAGLFPKASAQGLRSIHVWDPDAVLKAREHWLRPVAVIWDEPDRAKVRED